MNNRIIEFNTIDSTNAYCKAKSDELSSGTIVAAKEQTAGKGRLGRTFDSGLGGLYFSYFFKVDSITEKNTLITGMTAVAVLKAINIVCGANPKIKWTNDLLLGGKKICGVLCESGVNSKGESYVVIGVGLNTNRLVFPDELQLIASSIKKETGVEVDESKLFEEIIHQLDIMIVNWKSGLESIYVDEYRKACVTIGYMVKYIRNGAEEIASALDIDPRFGLVVEKDDGETLVLKSGEVSVIRT